MKNKDLLKLFVALEIVKKYKNDYVREQKFEEAVEWREFEKDFIKDIPPITELEDLWSKLMLDANKRKKKRNRN